MDEPIHEDALKKNTNLEELSLLEGIQVWSAEQKTLEEQALKELDIFSQENKTDNKLVQDDAIKTNSQTNDKLPQVSLDLEKYIQTQEALKERQSFQKIVSSTSTKEKTKATSKNICRPAKRRKKGNDEVCSTTMNTSSFNQENMQIVELFDNNHVKKDNFNEDSGSEYVPSEGEIDSDYEPGYENHKCKSTSSSNISKAIKRKHTDNVQINKLQDDGQYTYYKARLKEYYKKLEAELLLEQEMRSDDCEEIKTDEILKGGLKVPIQTWNKLYGYQQDGIKWLWKIHRKATGAILGDEMGLGKTVQIIAFLLSLEHSRVISCHGRFNGLGPSIIVCPATVIHQWVKHFHQWAPEFRVAVLHQSGNFAGEKADLIKEMHKSKGIIVSTYTSILKYKEALLSYNWHYLILDEGHKIRNPTAKISIAVKHIRTPHRILLTGSPMQNNLTELWSLFDFTNPGMLGNMTTFQEHFSTPILQGGFANSTPMQEATALSVATTLKDLISPYLLRRTKCEVQHHILLPNKSEQVLFCSLSDEQKDLYKGYLMSDHINSILGKGKKQWFADNHMRANVLVAITTLRKICNHPDIYFHETATSEDGTSVTIDEEFGYYKKSGKMIVVSALLKIWKKQGHRVLLFTQGRSMIAILSKFLQQEGYKYIKMDGSTSINSRQPMIEKFNQDDTYDVFLSTTRVGGLGVNLTGANRVIIYDPDWNPATDTQARERAWRIGQEKQVTIYRLLSVGTIEEKIYQRQVWKQLLSNKVLLDPKTSRFFKSSDLYDLFSLQESNDVNPETANIFHDSRVRIQENIRNNKLNKKKRSHSKNSNEVEIQFDEDKIQAMKNKAAEIAKSLSQTQKKTTFQLDLEEERQKKLKEREELKKLPPQALLHYNKDKANVQDDTSVNKIDDSEAKVGFEEALKYSEKTAKLHHALVLGKIKEPDKIVNKVQNIRKEVIKNDNENPLQKYLEKYGERSSTSSKSREKKRSKEKTVIDHSGLVDGEAVNGLVRTEKRISKKKKKDNVESPDDFVLGKLLQKKGISGALQHDSVVQSGSQGGNLRIHTEAKMRAEKSLEALRKSRLDNWRW